MAGFAGIRRSIWLTVTLAVAQVGGLALVIAVGAPHIGDVDLLAHRGSAGIMGAASLAFFSFIGFDEVITLAEETKNPTRTVGDRCRCQWSAASSRYSCSSPRSTAGPSPPDSGLTAIGMLVWLILQPRHRSRVPSV